MTSGPIEDAVEQLKVRRSDVVFKGAVTSMRVDKVLMPDGDLTSREVLVHTGSVGILALNEHGQVLVLHQLRHAVGRRLWEIPAGLLDVANEPPLAAAQRELAEEAHLWAAEWRILVDSFTSPGISTESVRIFVARGLTPAPGEPAPRSHEESDMELRWVDLDEILDGIRAGRLHNPLLIMGAPLLRLALDHGGLDALRAVDTLPG